MINKETPGYLNNNSQNQRGGGAPQEKSEFAGMRSAHKRSMEGAIRGAIKGRDQFVFKKQEDIRKAIEGYTSKDTGVVNLERMKIGLRKDRMSSDPNKRYVSDLILKRILKEK